MRSRPCACFSSMYVQNLFVAHMFAMVGLHSLSSVFDYFLVPLSFMVALLRDWALLDDGLCFSSAHPFSCYPLLQYHSIIPATKLFVLILLGLFGPAIYSSPNGPVRPLVLLLHHWWVPLSHMFSLGCPGLVCFPWAFSTIFLTSHSHRFLLNSLGFLDLITLSLILRAHGLAINPLLFHYFGLAVAHFHFFTSYTTYGLLFLSFWAPLSPFTSSRSICLSHWPMIH